MGQQEGIVDIKAEDCRVEGFAGGRAPRFNKATHLPTGVIVEFSHLLPKRQVLNELQKAVNEYERKRQSADA